jgi:beta-lactamase regulating signal transducer with metallopeptidase domain
MNLLITATLASSIAVLWVGVLRKPLRRLAGPQSAYWVWLLVPAVALAIFLPAHQEPGLARTLPHSVGEVIYSTMARVSPAGISSDYLQPGLAIWLLGVCAVSASAVLRQRAFIRSLGSMETDTDGMLCSAAIAGPMVLGAWRARVIVPADFADRYSSEERILMLAHEQAHLARGDALVNALAEAWLCLFWFNPLMYWAVGRLHFDQELACDARVVSGRAAGRKLYASALLKAQLPAAVARRLPIGCHWQSSHPLKERIAALKHPFPGFARRTGGAALAVALALSGIYAVTFASGTALAQKTSASSASIRPAWLAGSISIELQNKEVGEALTELARQSGHKVIVSPEAAQKLKQKVTMHFVDVQLGACLDLIVNTTGLVYRLSGAEPGSVITVDVPH